MTAPEKTCWTCVHENLDICGEVCSKCDVDKREMYEPKRQLILEAQNKDLIEALIKIRDHDTIDGAKYNNHADAYLGVVDFARQTLAKIQGA